MKKRTTILRIDTPYRRLIPFKTLLVGTFLLMATGLSAQRAVVKDSLSGLIQDARTGAPIAAARITVINKAASAVSDAQGRFTIALTSDNDVLNVQAYDYNTVEVPARGRRQLTILLNSEVFTPSFTTTMTLTGPQPRSRQVTAATTLRQLNDLNHLAADELIQGELGADVRGSSRSGQPGMGASLFIRGIHSLNANAQPLFVVDGVIWDNQYDVVSVQDGFFINSLVNIDLQDIETITVLKDGTSLYGSKASNGVILITTKRGKDPVTKIGLNVLTSFTTAPRSLPMMDGESYRLYAADMYGSMGYSGAQMAQLGFVQQNPAHPQYNVYHNNTDWNDQTYQQGRSNQYLIDVTGGDEKAMYYFSVGMTNGSSVIKETDFSRVNTRFNTDLKLLRNLDLGVNVGFTRLERTLQDDGINFYSSPTWLAKIKSPIVSPYGFTQQGEITPDYADTDALGIGNPIQVLLRSLNSTKTYKMNVNIAPVYRLNKHFTLTTVFDYNLYKGVERRYVPMKGTAARPIEGKGFSENELNSQVMRNTSFFSDTRLTFDKTFDTMHHLKALYGVRYLDNYYESDYMEEHNTGDDNNTIITGSNDFLSVDGINNKTKSLSNYLQAEYTYDERYMLTATMAVDGSSRFGRHTEGGFRFWKRSWGVFPSLNAGWLISSETFMQDLEAVNYAKLRAGYGLTGNDGMKDYESMTYFTIVRYMGAANGLLISNLANDALQWETTGRANLGLDLGLFNDRLNLTMDVYSSRTNNLLTLRKAPYFSGLGYVWKNGGTLSNKGYEASAMLKVLNNRMVKWEVGLGVGHYANTIEELPGGAYITPVYGGDVLSAVGEAAGSFYGYKTRGVFKNQDEAAAAYTNPETGVTGPLSIRNTDGSLTPFSAGDIQFEEVVKDGIIDENDRQVIGNPNPDLYGNLTSRFFVGRFTLTTLFTYSLGNDLYNYNRSLLEAGKDLSNQTAVMIGRWTGENQQTTQPRAVYGDPMGNARFSDRWIEDGSYLRLKHLKLSYELPLRSTYLQGVTMWASASNLYTWTNYLGLDPDVTGGNTVYEQGVDAGLIPNTPTFAVGFRLNL